MITVFIVSLRCFFSILQTGSFWCSLLSFSVYNLFETKSTDVVVGEFEEGMLSEDITNFAIVDPNVVVVFCSMFSVIASFEETVNFSSVYGVPSRRLRKYVINYVSDLKYGKN